MGDSVAGDPVAILGIGSSIATTGLAHSGLAIDLAHWPPENTRSRARFDLPAEPKWTPGQWLSRSRKDSQRNPWDDALRQRYATTGARQWPNANAPTGP
jgi:hypothetical protein